MTRAPIVLTLVLLGCGDSTTPIDAAVIDAATVDASVDAGAPDCDGGCAGAGEVCGDSPVDLDAGARPCGAGLVCCYPCGVANCEDRCIAPCAPGSGCQESGCPGPFP
ncbi:MAG: hypothetical protein IPL61_33950 [Myxococcales bacterium]|nr:hypothetical protein [Myxococcales bacterium]